MQANSALRTDHSGFRKRSSRGSISRKLLAPGARSEVAVSADVRLTHFPIVRGSVINAHRSSVADARNRDYRVEVPANCVATFDPDAHRWALKHMEKVLGAVVVPGLS